MKFPVLWSGLCCYTVKCSEILHVAHIKLLYNPRVNKVFTSLPSNHDFRLLGFRAKSILTSISTLGDFPSFLSSRISGDFPLFHDSIFRISRLFSLFLSPPQRPSTKEAFAEERVAVQSLAVFILETFKLSRQH